MTICFVLNNTCYICCYCIEFVLGCIAGIYKVAKREGEGEKAGVRCKYYNKKLGKKSYA